MEASQENIDRELGMAVAKVAHYIEAHLPAQEVAVDLVMALVAMQELVDKSNILERELVLENIYKRFPQIKEHVQKVARATAKGDPHGPN